MLNTHTQARAHVENKQCPMQRWNLQGASPRHGGDGVSRTRKAGEEALISASLRGPDSDPAIEDCRVQDG